MKNTILSTIAMAFILVSCNQKSKESTTNSTPMTNNNSEMMDHNSKIYSCPMHPEVQGKLNDKCSKCGMELNVEVKK